MPNTPYTSPEAVERLAQYHFWRDDGESQTANMLRTLSAALEGEKARAEAAEAELARLKQRVLDDTKEIQDMTQDHMDTIKAHLELERHLSARAEAAEAERDAIKAELYEAVGVLLAVLSHGREDWVVEKAFTFLARHLKDTDT